MDSDAVSFKLQRIYLPLVALAAALLVGYSLLNWFLVASRGFIPASDNVIDYWLPLGLTGILLLIYIRPTLALLKRDQKGNAAAFYACMAIAFVAVPTIVAQEFIRTASGALTHVKDAGDIPLAAATKYYAADDVCVDYTGVSLKPVVWASGKSNQTLNVDLYAVEPVCPTQSSTPGTRSVWIGLKAHTSFSNSLAAADKEAKFQAFLESAQARFRAEDTRSYRFLEKAGRNADGKGFRAALHNANPRFPTSTIVLIPHHEPFDQRNGEKLPWVFGSFAIGMGLWLVMAVVCPLDRNRQQAWLEANAARTRSQPLRELRRLLPKPEWYGLSILIGMNVLVFIAMVLAGLGMLSFDRDDLLTWGANYRPALHGFGLLRLISYQFVHGGLMHLLGNLYGLFFAGIFLSMVTRKAGLIACYLVCGVCAGIASSTVHPTIVSVGASGSIFGLFGILLTLAVLKDTRVAAIWKVILVNVAIYAGINLALGAITPGTDNAAHIGGLAAGVILGLGIHLSKYAKPSEPNERQSI